MLKGNVKDRKDRNIRNVRINTKYGKIYIYKQKDLKCNW